MRMSLSMPPSNVAFAYWESFYLLSTSTLIFSLGIVLLRDIENFCCLYRNLYRLIGFVIAVMLKACRENLVLAGFVLLFLSL